MSEAALEPTDEQLENTCLMLGLPYLSPGLRPSCWRQSMLNLHSLVQRTLLGDELAEASLQTLLDAFGVKP